MRSYTIVAYTVVPVMNGYPREQAKVSVHDRWSHIKGTAGVPNVIPLHECITGDVIVMFAIVIERKINA